MELTRTGFVFSLAAIVFLSVLTIVLGAATQSQAIDTGDYSARTTLAVRERLESVYLPLIVRSVSTSALQAASADAYNRGVYLSLDRDFTSGLENATYGPALNWDLSVRNLREEFLALETAMNASGTPFQIRIKQITIQQSGTFEALVRVNVSYKLNSSDGFVRYNRNFTITTTVPLQSVTDLYYSNEVLTEPGVPDQSPRVFRAQIPRDWNNSEFNRTWNDYLYMDNNRAPSVFERLQGLSGASLYGVETVMPPGTTEPLANMTHIDWEYFTDTQHQCTYTFSAQPDIDDGVIVSFVTLTEYNLTNAQKVQGAPWADGCPDSPTWP